MLIQCPFCRNQARISEEKEGAKVKCSSCAKVYVARELGRPGAGGKGGPSPVHIGIGAGVLAAVLIFAALLRSKSDDKQAQPGPAQAAPVAQAPAASSDGWDSKPVQAVAELYTAAFEGNTGRVQVSLFQPKLYERLRAAQLSGAPDVPFNQLKPKELSDCMRRVAEELCGKGENSLGAWTAFDGKVLSQTVDEATVQVEVSSRSADQGVESRRYKFELAREGERWKAWNWERMPSAADLEREKNPNALAAKGVTKSQTKEGGLIYQADMRALEHLEDTPEALRKEIDETVLRLIDYDLPPKENNRARTALVGMGRPAIPILLTKIYETKISDDTQLAKVTNLYQTLVDITGYDPGFSPLGTSEDSEKQREQALKAYFAWWLRKGEDKFEKRAEHKDLLEEMLEPTERDRRQMEADKRKAEGGI